MTWRGLAEDVWCLDDVLVQPGGVRFPVRCVAVRLPDGGLWVWSPVRFSEGDAAALEALGPVHHLVSPCALHHLFLGPAIARWPGATTWAPAGLSAKRRDLRLDRVLGRDPAPWEDTIARVHIAGNPWVDEHDFVHLPTGTLMVADLVFHVTAPENLRTRLLLALVGVGTGLGQSRLWRWTTRDRSAAGASCSALLALPVHRLVPAHGAVVSEDAARRLEAALGWMLGDRRALTA